MMSADLETIRMNEVAGAVSGDDDKVGEALKAQRFQMLEDIARELAGEVVFPTCFDVALRLRKELSCPSLSIARLADIVSVEPLVSAKLLHLANSAAYAAYSASGKPVQDLKAAISRLGLNVVRATALAVAMNQILHAKEMAGFSHLAHDLWEHSVKSAVTARILARTYTHISPDEAFLAGLVHDLGAFYMLYRASLYPELRARPETVRHLIMQWHESIGVTLLGALGLPEEIVAASIDHDHPHPVPDIPKTLAEIVYVANLLAGAGFELLYLDSDPEALLINQAHAKFTHLLPEVETATHEMRAILG